MNKKIKIIELANNIAGEKWDEVPKKIRCGNSNYIFDRLTSRYKDEECNNYVLVFHSDTLNNCVEILEDNTEEIEELPDYNYSIKENRDKINELVRRIKYIERKINE